MLSRLIYAVLVIKVCSVLLSNQALADYEDSPAPMVWGYAEFAPHMWTADNGRVIGEIADVIHGLLQDGDYHYVTFPAPNRRLLEGLLKSQIDMLTVVPFRHPYQELMLVGDSALGELEMRVYWQKGKAKPIQSLAHLNNQHVITIAGYTYSNLFDREGGVQNARQTAVESHTRALTALVRERADYMIDYRKTAEYHMQQMGIEGLESFKIQRSPVYIALRSDYPNAAGVLQDLQTRYVKLFPERYRTYNPGLKSH